MENIHLNRLLCNNLCLQWSKIQIWIIIVRNKTTLFRSFLNIIWLEILKYWRRNIERKYYEWIGVPKIWSREIVKLTNVPPLHRVEKSRMRVNFIIEYWFSGSWNEKSFDSTIDSSSRNISDVKVLSLLNFRMKKSSGDGRSWV